MKKISRDEAREVLMSITDEIARICKENGLRYYIACGTLLGAVRHKGFIPWDDDLDLIVMRDDYDKLMALLKDKNVKKAEWLEVVDDTRDDYFCPFAKVCDRRTAIKMDRHKAAGGLWVDVFPYDGLPSSKFFAGIYTRIAALFRVICLAMDTDFSSKTLSTWNLIYKRFFWILATVIGRKRFCRFVEWFHRRYDIRKSKYVTSLFFDTRVDTILDKEMLLPQAVFQFENREYTSFANYDYLLKRMYGDYMKLPPEEKRITHDFNAWWIEEGGENA